MEFLDMIVEFITSIPDMLFELLPESPVLNLSLAQYSTYLHWLNWFVPFDWLLNMLGIYLGLFGVTIVVRAILRYFGVLS